MPGILRALGGWWARRRVLSEMHGITREEKETATYYFEAQLEAVKAALVREDRKTALTLWQQARAAFPAEARRSPQGLEILLHLQRFDEAEELMQEGRRERPGNPFFDESLAIIAQQRGDIPLALERWSQTRRKHPQRPRAYAQEAACLARLSRFAEAEAVVAQGVKAFPSDLYCALEHARLADVREDWETALQRWERLAALAREPTQLPNQLALIGRAQTLQKMTRLDDAEREFQEARRLFPLDNVPAIELARIAEQREDWTEAARRWGQFATRFAVMPIGFLNHATALGRIGQTEEAFRVLGEAARRFPDDPAVVAAYAQAQAQQQSGNPNSG